MGNLENNVIQSVRAMSEIVAKREGGVFRDDMESRLLDSRIASPIERVFFCAFVATLKINFERETQVESINRDRDSTIFLSGFHIEPQAEIGKYRVDFLIEYHSRSMSIPKPPGELIPTKRVIVECDSQEFHERTERERRYEKERDRYFSKNNITSLHFTGTEILTEPIRVATEVLEFLTERGK